MGKRHGPEEIIGKLREAEIVLAQGGTTGDACRRIAVTGQTYYRWRKEYGGLKTDQARRMKVPQKQPRRGRLWLNDGSCIRLRPEYPGHVWAYDFVEGRTHDGRKFRILTIIDEASRECLALVVARRFRHEDVLAALAELFIARGRPANIRSDNGPEFIATAVQKWLAQVDVKMLYITPASPW